MTWLLLKNDVLRGWLTLDRGIAVLHMGLGGSLYQMVETVNSE